MSKQISNGELAEIVTGLLIGRLGPEQLDTPERYSAFMTGLAELVCEHCGGTVTDLHADNSSEEWLIGIRSNECLPEDGGVWGKFDPDGDLDDDDPDDEHEDGPGAGLPTAVVWLEGGVVHWVASDFPMRYLVLDADTDGGSESMKITMENGSEAEVIRTPYTMMTDCLPAWVHRVVAEVESQS